MVVVGDVIMFEGKCSFVDKYLETSHAWDSSVFIKLNLHAWVNRGVIIRAGS